MKKQYQDKFRSYLEFLRKTEKEVSCILEECEQEIELLEKEMDKLDDRIMKLDIFSDRAYDLEEKRDELEDKYDQIQEFHEHIEEALNPLEDALYTIENLVSQIEFEEKLSKMTLEERLKYLEEHRKKLRKKLENYKQKNIPTE